MKDVVEQINLLLKDLQPILIPITGLTAIKAKEWFDDYRESKFNLVDHSFLLSLTSFLRDLETWNVRENRAVFIDMYREVLRSFLHKSTDIAKGLDTSLKTKTFFFIKKMTGTKLRKVFTQLMNDCIQTYSNRWKELEIPSQAINKFHVDYLQKIKRIDSAIIEISYNNDQYRTAKSKSIAILSLCEIFLYEINSEVLKLCLMKEMNGSFKGIYYKTLPLNDEEYKEMLGNLEKLDT